MMHSMQTPTMVLFMQCNLSPACPLRKRSTCFGPPTEPRAFSTLSTFSSPRLIRINGLIETNGGSKALVRDRPPALPLTAPTTDVLSRKDFPSDFIFGAGSSAFQIEGAPTSGGRGNSIWDSFIHIPGNVKDGSLNYPGCDFYHHYEKYINHAKELGFDAFRLSISWTRIYPNGSGEESAEGIEFYNKVINAILNAGLTPFVTLFHWETPQYLENDPDVLGFRTKNIVPYFVKFAETCFKHFGDRVKKWVTINEMYIFSRGGYALGTSAPGRCSFVSENECDAGDSRIEPYQVGHNLLLAHAKVYQLYNNRYKVHQQGVCGINPYNLGVEPYSNKQEDILATQRYLESITGWQLDPVVFGDYPRSMRNALGDRLPKFTKEESEELKNSCDFFAHNYYTASFIKHTGVPKDPSERWFSNDAGATEMSTNEYGQSIGTFMGPSGNSFIHNCPSQLVSLLEWMEHRYGKIECYIAENGVMDSTPNNAIEALDDIERVTYLKDHLMHLSKAIKDKGINLKGYFSWAIVDVFEWRSGLEWRFGLTRVDLEDGKPPLLTLKSSAKWFQDFLVKKT